MRKNGGRAKKSNGAKRSNGKSGGKRSSVEPVNVATPSAGETDRALAAVMDRAMALPATDVEVVAIGANLALHNAQLGAGSVLAEKKALDALLRAFDASRVEDVVTLALAYGSASRRVDRSGTGEVARLYAILAPLRAMALSSCASLARAALLPAQDVARIEAGRGKIDGAQDGVDLAALMRKHWSKISNKTAVTTADLAALDETGRALLAILKPSTGRSEASDGVKSALDLRNRVGTLLTREWLEMWKLGALVYGPDGIGAAVPPLQSVAGAGRKPKAKPAVAAGAGATVSA